MGFCMLSKLFSLFSHDIGIDLGTANTLICVRGKGVVIREPSVVALHRKTKQLVALGDEAKRMIGKTPATILTVRPLRGGVISDFDATVALIERFLRQVHEVGMWPLSLARPRVAIGIPSACSEVERRAVWDAVLCAGAREAFLIEEPMAAAIGEGISVFAPTGVMLVDIGGGTSEIAVISLGGIVVSRSLRIGGEEMDRAIVHSIRLRHGLLLGESTAEHIKVQIGSASEVEKKKGELEKMLIVRGRDIETGLPRTLRVGEVAVREALAPIVAQIIEGIAETLAEAPPELASDILTNGIFLTGGGANLPGLARLIVERTHMPVVVSLDPMLSVVRGAGKVLEDERLLRRVMVTGGLS